MPTWAKGLIVAVVVVVVLGITGAAFLSTRQQPTPPQPNYAINFVAGFIGCPLEYQGKTPERGYFFLVGIFLNNTGNTTLRIVRDDFWLANIDGILIAYPDARFDTVAYVDVTPGEPVSGTLVFDLPSDAEPAKVVLSLPDGSHVSESVSAWPWISCSTPGTSTS